MQPGIAARRRGDLGEARARQAGGGEGLQGGAVIGAAEPGASECRKRGAGLRRVVDRIAGEARSARRGALPFVVEMGTVEHRFLPRRSSTDCAHMLTANILLWRRHDRFLAIGRPRNERLGESIISQLRRRLRDESFDMAVFDEGMHACNAKRRQGSRHDRALHLDDAERTESVDHAGGGRSALSRASDRHRQGRAVRCRPSCKVAPQQQDPRYRRHRQRSPSHGVRRDPAVPRREDRHAVAAGFPDQMARDGMADVADGWARTLSRPGLTIS